PRPRHAVGLRLGADRLRRRDGLEPLARSDMPAVWQRSVEEALAVIDLLDARIAPLEAELQPFAHADPNVALLRTIPGVRGPLALTPPAEIAHPHRFAPPR